MSATRDTFDELLRNDKAMSDTEDVNPTIH
jgi:hypothetical protein